MFKKRTLFVVGAGASVEFGMEPGVGMGKLIGRKLSIESRRFLNNAPQMADMDISNAMVRRGGAPMDALIGAANAINAGVEFAHSIDDFLDNHADNEYIRMIGKIAIAKTILEQERKSHLYFDKSNMYNRMRVAKFEDTWLIKFARLLGRGVQKGKIKEIFENVSFIVFNYDRCIEQCLYHALQQLFSIPANQASEILDELTIFHPYGRVGPLQTETTPNGTLFGGRFDELREDYSRLSDGIRTYTEQVKDKAEIDAMRRLMAEAEQIVFLGFAFHEQNLVLLKAKEKMEPKKVYGTAFGMSDSDVEIIKAQLMNFFKLNADEITYDEQYFDIRNDLTCAKFFDQYGRSLSG